MTKPTPDDNANLWAELYRLREDVKGPEGVATWKEAAISERMKRIELIPLAKFGAMVAASHMEGDSIDAGDLTIGMLDSAVTLDTDGVVGYAPNIEATITKLLKDEK
jgi:hypothetical protein